MLLDTMLHGGDYWGEPVCPSCRQLIRKDEPTEDVRFKPDSVHKLQELNGAYHAVCAKPVLSLKRVYDMLGRRW